MALKAGYRQTEIGVIPEDWTILSIQDLIDNNSILGHLDGNHGELYPRSDEFKSFGVPYITANDFGNHYVNFQSCKFLSETRAKRFRKGIAKNGDVLFAHNATVGPVAMLKTNLEYVILSTTATYFRCNPEKLSNTFVLYLLQSPLFVRQYQAVMSQSTRNQVPITAQRKLIVALPPTKAEQEAIAEALSDADALIESLEQLIAKKGNIKQGAMQELLCPKDGWCIKKLEDIADVIDPHPSHRAPAVVLNGIPFVGIGDLNENGDLIGTKIRTVDPSVLDEHLARYNLNEELIGLGRVASIGKVVKLKYTGANYTISPTLGVIRGTKVRRDYLLYALKSKAVADQFNKIMSGSTRSSVGMVVLRKLDIALPVKETEQTAIATILSDMDAEIAALETRLSKTRALKQGMMHNLLTGRIRLPGQSMAVDLSQ